MNVVTGLILAGAGLAAPGTAPTVAQGPVIDVPLAPPPVIDGRLDEAEWQGSVPQRLTDETVVRFQHDGRHLFLGIRSSRPGFASVCVAGPDTVRVYHASAALGSVAYERSAGAWVTGDREFAYAMRNPDLTEAARRERSEYLSRHGWVASTFRMGGGLEQELQVSLERVSGMTGIAVAFFIPSGDTGTVVTWPATLAPDDGCGDERLVRGSVPSPLRFEPDRWARLTLTHSAGPGPGDP
jgi:hypothetical protein